MLLKLQECFDPIADGRSGGDLIPLMVYRYVIIKSLYGDNIVYVLYMASMHILCI